jgi:hypothetical protein
MPYKRKFIMQCLYKSMRKRSGEYIRLLVCKCIMHTLLQLEQIQANPVNQREDIVKRNILSPKSVKCSRKLISPFNSSHKGCLPSDSNREFNVTRP